MALGRDIIPCIVRVVNEILDERGDANTTNVYIGGPAPSPASATPPTRECDNDGDTENQWFDDMVFCWECVDGAWASPPQSKPLPKGCCPGTDPSGANQPPADGVAPGENADGTITNPWVVVDPATLTILDLYIWNDGIWWHFPNCCPAPTITLPDTTAEGDEHTDAAAAGAGQPPNTIIMLIGDGTAADPDWVWIVDEAGNVINIESPDCCVDEPMEIPAADVAGFADPTAPTDAEINDWIAANGTGVINQWYYIVGDGTVNNPDFTYSDNGDGTGTNHESPASALEDNGDGTASDGAITTLWHCPSDGGEVDEGGKIAVESEGGCAPQVLRDPICSEVLSMTANGKAGWVKRGEQHVPIGNHSETSTWTNEFVHDWTPDPTPTTFVNPRSCDVYVKFRGWVWFQLDGSFPGPQLDVGDFYTYTFFKSIIGTVADISGFTRVFTQEKGTSQVVDHTATVPGAANYEEGYAVYLEHKVRLTPGQAVTWNREYRKRYINTSSDTDLDVFVNWQRWAIEYDDAEV